MLTVRSLSRRFGNIHAVDDVSFDVVEGEVLAVIGANGAGKSTLIKCLVGLLRFDGEASLDGIDIRRNGKAARARVGYLPQSPAFHPDLTLQETMAFYAGLRGTPVDQCPGLLETVGLADRAETPVGELSGGMRQRLGLAVALLGEPALLALDEPASGLDVSARLELRRLVSEQRRQGRSVLLSTHWLEDVPYVADRALLLDKGRVVYLGSAQSLATGQASASRVFLRLNGHSGAAVPLIEQFTGDPVGRSGDWLVARCQAAQKAQLIESLIGAGIAILDLRVEEAPIDEAVLHLQGMGGH
jgi:ABC-type multidrug transport system ATPase subunit